MGVKSKIRALLAILGSVVALMIGNTGTAYAGTGPSVWEFGNPGDTCTGSYQTTSGACFYYERSSTFQLGASGITLQYKPSGGGALMLKN